MERLIDAETLKARIGELCINNADMFSVSAYGRIIGVIEVVPSIDVHPVRHGRWIPLDSKTAKCSICGWWQRAKTYRLPDDITAFSCCYRFCTACGALVAVGDTPKTTTAAWNRRADAPARKRKSKTKTEVHENGME